MGGLHAVHWSKSSFSSFLHLFPSQTGKQEKRKKCEKKRKTNEKGVYKRLGCNFVNIGQIDILINTAGKIYITSTTSFFDMTIVMLKLQR